MCEATVISGFFVEHIKNHVIKMALFKEILVTEKYKK